MLQINLQVNYLSIIKKMTKMFDYFVNYCYSRRYVRGVYGIFCKNKFCTYKKI